MRLLSLIAVLIGSGNLFAQVGPETIRDLCKAAGEKGVEIAIVSDSGPPLPFEHTLRLTTMIVRGIIGPSQGQLTNGDHNIVTIFEMQDPQILFAAKAGPATLPGQPLKMTFTLNGGSVMLNGCKASVWYDGVPPLKAGTHVVFLMTEAAGGELHPLGRGMFTVGNSGLIPMVRGLGEHMKFEGRSVDEFVAEILTARKALR